MRQTRNGRDRRESDQRGQTTIDFGIGAGVFLIVVAFVVAFIPTMTAPFDTGPQEETVAADRIANTLNSGLLGDPSEPTILDPTCTGAFFNGSTGDTGCNFDDSAPLHEQLGVSDRLDVAVTISDDPSGSNPLCLAPDGTVDEVDCDPADGDIIFDRSVSSPPTDRGSVITARRSVSVGGVRGSLVVRVW